MHARNRLTAGEVQTRQPTPGWPSLVSTCNDSVEKLPGFRVSAADKCDTLEPRVKEWLARLDPTRDGPEATPQSIGVGVDIGIGIGS